MQDPLEFATILLGREGWTREQVEERLASLDTLTIKLTEPLPVIVAYLTATTDEAGAVYFFADIYGKDGAVQDTL
jgi:murein L,D-transpeptidase YcbB/YkuD